jgi:preprotein translocase subunit SecE
LSTNTQTTTGSSAIDWLKWLVVFGLAGGAIFANWYYQDQPLLYRVGALLVVAVLVFLMAIQTEKGRATWTLIREARGEIRRVVWPTKAETGQTTMIVLVLVFVFAFILWLLDSGLSWLVKSVIG